MRKNIRRRYKLSLRTDDSIEEIITMTATIVTTAITPCITATDRNYVASYVTRKDVAYRNILRRSKKSLRLSLKISLRTDSRSE